MKRYIKTLNEFFSHLSEEDEEEIAKPKSPEEEEEEDEQDAEDLEKDYNIFDIDEAPVQLEYYNDLTESIATKLGLKYDGPYSSEENTVANLGDKHPLNLDDWNNVYYKIYSESNDNPPLYLEYITDPDALEEFMKENGKHWPNVFIYENKDEDFDQKYTMEARESGMINWLKKEFDEPPKNESFKPSTATNTQYKVLVDISRNFKKDDIVWKSKNQKGGPKGAIEVISGSTSMFILKHNLEKL